ncbi:hypothetical protein EYB25_002315 [Talaromyces marneffei]|nr:hypothetical protein EYB25_002315 [Talaromyces marneffei]
MKDKDFQFEFRTSQTLQAKPQLGQPLPVANGKKTFGPGSDMALVHPDLVLANINDTHLLVANLYCVFRPQLMLLTKDSYRRQHESLSAEDLAAAEAFLVAIHKPFYVMFNCSAMAGASREHKHMHILPRDDENESSGIPAVEAQLKNLPFQFFWSRVDFDEGSLLQIYDKLLANARKTLNLAPSAICPHNAIFTQTWLMIIPRRSNDFHGLTSNAPGMVGSVWLQNEAQLEKWTQLGPTKVLSHLGVAKEPSI